MGTAPEYRRGQAYSHINETIQLSLRRRDDRPSGNGGQSSAQHQFSPQNCPAPPPRSAPLWSHVPQECVRRSPGPPARDRPTHRPLPRPYLGMTGPLIRRPRRRTGRRCLPRCRCWLARRFLSADQRCSGLAWRNSRRFRPHWWCHRRWWSHRPSRWGLWTRIGWATECLTMWRPLPVPVVPVVPVVPGRSLLSPSHSAQPHRPGTCRRRRSQPGRSPWCWTCGPSESRR